MKADLVISNANIVDVCVGDIYLGSIAIKSDRIIGIGNVNDLISDSTIVIDVSEGYVCPGFIDAHLHIESSMVTLTEFAKAVLPHGTTSIVIDPHEIANVLGVNGIRMLIEESKYVPLNIYFTIPSCVPAAPGFETSGAELNVDDVKKLLELPMIVGLGEVMDFPGVLSGNLGLMEKISITRNFGKRVDGHAPLLTGRILQNYISAGIHSDHECISGVEVLERIRCGMWIMVREGSLSKNLNEILSFIHKLGVDTSRIMFATDDLTSIDALNSHINKLVKMAIDIGFDPIDAIKMATLNSAIYYRLDDEIGILAPGFKANLIVLEDLKKINVKMTIVNGKLIAENGRVIVQIYKWKYPVEAYRTINVRRVFYEDDFKIKVDFEFGSVDVRVIGVEDRSLYTKSIVTKLPIKSGIVNFDLENDILQVAVVERHKATGNIGLGFVKGFGLKCGALASSVAHDSHNIVVVGANWSDMAYAVNKLIEMGGGIIVVNEESILSSLPLPIAGLMSDEDIYTVSSKFKNLHECIRKIGCILEEPFMTLSFIALSVIPELKITDKGLIWHDIKTGRIGFVNPIVKFDN